MTLTIQIGYNEVSVENLLLDNLNPRLPPEAVTYTQSQLCNILVERFNLDPLVFSIVNYGFFKAEPLVGIYDDNKNKVIVVEGNRRLAVLKLMTDEEINKSSLNPDKWKNYYSQLITNGHIIGNIAVMIYRERKEIYAFLGYRHIQRTLEWEPLAKARFINNIIEDNNIKTFNEAAVVVNSRSDTVRNNYVAYRVFLQAKEDFKIDVDKVEGRFGVFYTALNNTDIRNYIGLKRKQNIEKLKKPIEKNKSKKLQNLIYTLHGNNELDPVFSDSRDIYRLGKILIKKESEKVLLETRDMDLAEKYLEEELEIIVDNFDTIIHNFEYNIELLHKYCKDKRIIRRMNTINDLYIKLIEICPDDNQGG